MRTPRIFVGTMHSAESEFEECKQKIAQQSCVEVHHCILENLPEYEAHNKLWESWNSVKSDFDLFIKVDADTLIDDSLMFSKIWLEFEKTPRLTGMQIKLHDYFTDGLISGLNCFSPRVVFKPATSRLHADHADTNHDIVFKGKEVIHLTPAGRHCAYPGQKQSFHYGLHRMKKGQVDTIRNVLDAWKRIGGDGRLFALHGAAVALRKNIEHDYGSLSFEQEFDILLETSCNQESIDRMLSVIERV